MIGGVRLVNVLHIGFIRESMTGDTMARYTYYAWEGSQEIPRRRTDDMFHAFTHDLLQHGDVHKAIQGLLRPGDTPTTGYEDLLQQLQAVRDTCLNRYAADSFRLDVHQVNRFEAQIESALTSATDMLNRCHEALPAGRSHRQMQENVLRQRYQSLQRRLETRCGKPSPGRETEVSQHFNDWLSHVQPATQRDDRALSHSTANLLRLRAQVLRQHHTMLTALERYLDRVQRAEEQLNTFPFCGTQTLGVEEADRLARDLHDLDTILQRARRHPETQPDLNLKLLHHLLRQTETTQALRPNQIEMLLQQAGLIHHSTQGLILTPKGIRQIGARMLHDIFRNPQSPRRVKSDDQNVASFSQDTKPYNYGDPLNLHLSRTFTNALRRHPARPVRLHPDDFEVYRLEPSTPHATVLMLDVSQSMALTGQHRFVAAKKVALALAHLIQTRFPHDVLHIVGFGTQARQLQASDLPYLKVGREHTNTQQGLQLALRLLGRQRSRRKQIVMITDGRPTAAWQGDELFVDTRDLHPLILEATYKEARRCRQHGVRLNTFMLAADNDRVAFVKRLTSISQGQVFYATPQGLGAYVIEDYLHNRQRRKA